MPDDLSKARADALKIFVRGIERVSDDRLAAGLERSIPVLIGIMEARIAGVDFAKMNCDFSDPEAVRAKIAELQATAATLKEGNK